MRKVLRSERGQAVLSWLASVVIGGILATMRWRFENRAPADAICASSDGAVACFWHGRIIHGVACRQVLKAKPRRVLVSRSRDGEFISRTVARLSFPTIRGSSGRGGDGKGGAKAVMEAVRFIREGGIAVITPDGPRGPFEVLSEGPVQLARLSGVDTYLFGLAARPAINLKSWDRMQVPLPFGRGCVVFDGPLPPPPRDADAATLEAYRLDWQTRLSAAQQRAEAILAGR